MFPNQCGKRRQRLVRKHGIAAFLTGKRSSFREWAAEEMGYPRQVVEASLAHKVPNQIEAALAHVVRNRVEAAYARSDPFERRRTLIGDWARYLAQGMGEDREPQE